MKYRKRSSKKWQSLSLFYEDGALDPIFALLRSDDRWEINETGGFEGVDYIIYMDGRVFVYYSSIRKVYSFTGGMTYTILTAEEQALFDSILSNPIVSQAAILH